MKTVLDGMKDRYRIIWAGDKEDGIYSAIFCWLEWHFTPSPFEYVVKIMIDRRVFDEERTNELLDSLKHALPATYRTLTDKQLGEMISSVEGQD